MPRTNTLNRLNCQEDILECVVGTNPEDHSWEPQAERILGIKTKRHERRVKNEYHKQTQQHREYLKRNR